MPHQRYDFYFLLSDDGDNDTDADDLVCSLSMAAISSGHNSHHRLNSERDEKIKAGDHDDDFDYEQLNCEIIDFQIKLSSTTEMKIMT